MRFQVPQFVEVEDKIIGPLTISQFVFLAGGIGFLVAMWLLLPLWLAVIIGGPIAILGLALAFYKVNDRPFINVMQSAIEYFFKDKLYIWNKDRVIPKKDAELELLKQGNDPAQFVPAATSAKIKDLSWSLDIKESDIYSDKTQK